MENELIDCRDRNGSAQNISPIGIYLDFNHWPKLYRNTLGSTQEINQFVEFLCENNQSSIHRPIALMWWRHLFDSFAPADTTQLMHQLSRKFHLCSDSNREYCIEILPSFCSENQLALLRGLGFNHLILPLTSALQSAEQKPLAVNRFFPLLQKFKFEKIIFSLSMQDITEASFDGILNHVRLCQPCRIIFTDPLPIPCTARCPSQKDRSRILIQTDHHCVPNLQYVTREYITQALQSLGYIAMGRAWFVKHDDELHSASAHVCVSPLGYNRVNVRELISLPHFFPT